MKRGFYNKKSQMKISFGMMFSIILIIFFLGFGIYGIMKFLEISECAKIGSTIDGLEKDIDKMWKSSQGSQEVSYYLPKDIEYLCFIDYDSEERGKNKEIYSLLKRSYFGEPENLEFYPEEAMQCLESIVIKHIDMESITSEENPFCLENKNGKVSMRLKKDFGTNLVRITR